MEVVAIDRFIARCRAKGCERDVSLLLIQDQPVSRGDYLMVHVGDAVRKMTAEEARSAWELYDQILSAGEAPALVPGNL